ncbi:hypothetical protein ASD24_24520 [Paenibacillus sp. Root52]|uniref:hypothetical protein n=1 Tax=Paenibacillus sp. Root52 TaxID=1736552 RepID=UPI0006FEF369|nr:hypothetical protein [Paenibacillus sp. Root52]KQY90964.1 hypothetical protein ASD24_24520 [Paenibacillus sp. Root52]
MIKAVAFKAKNKNGRYLPDGIDCGDWDDEDMDTNVLSNALLVIRQDLKEPVKQDVQDFYTSLSESPMSTDVQSIQENYDPVPVILTQSELNIVRERNQW